MKIYLLANDWPGAQVAKHLVECGDTIEKLYLHNANEQKYADQIKANAKVPEDRIYSVDILKDPEHFKEMRQDPPDFIITVFWSYLLKPDFFCLAKNTLNFHLALLPTNRGWYPHVHSILDGTPTGVTIHQINEKADAGPVWAQKEVSLLDEDTAYDIYHRLRKEIIELFKKKWPLIKAGKIKPVAQDESKAVYHKKKEADFLDTVDLSRLYSGSQIINLLRARSFGKKGFAFFEKNGKKTYLNLKLSKNPEFDNPDNSK
ncbi:MAG: formyltransferase family protein [Candidatus Aceula meridiana]|nr:formyltransferase family protein [Candidatus Aceula meridiana]